MRKSMFLKTKTLAALTLMAALLALLAGGCGGGPSPTNVAEDFARQMNDRKFGEIYDLLSIQSPIRKEISRDDFVGQYESIYPEGFRLADFKITEERIEGDSKAMVLWTATAVVPGRADEPTNRTFSMVSEDGSWKIEQ
ncbi:MAG: NTF2-like N-terminal transpeptidase domain-containing protein [Thermoleophilia bacterium]